MTRPDQTAPVAAHRSLDLPAEPIEIAAGWLQLRPWEIGLAPRLAELVADPLERQWSPVPLEGDPLSHAEKKIGSAAERWRTRNQFSLAVQDATSGDLLGEIQLNLINDVMGSALAGYSTLPHARGRGVAPAALGAICRWAFEAAGFHRIELSHAVENAPSCRVAVKAGFPAEGIMRSYLPKPSGGWWDVELHAAINPAD